jgi:hypothetical protein
LSIAYGAYSMKRVSKPRTKDICGFFLTKIKSFFGKFFRFKKKERKDNKNV